MHRQAVLLMVLVSLLTGYGCAGPKAQTQSEVDYIEHCARRYHTDVLELVNSPTPEAEEYQVYAAVLEAEFIITRTESIVIHNGFLLEDFVDELSESAIYAAEKLTVTEELLDDFYTKNCKLKRIKDFKFWTIK